MPVKPERAEELQSGYTAGLPDQIFPSDLRESLHHFHNLTTDEQVLRAFSEAGIRMFGKPPFRDLSEMSSADRENFKRSLGLADDELSEAVGLGSKLSLVLGDVVEEARTARHPLLVAKLIGMYAGLLDAQLRKVVPVLRERGYTWTQIGTALGITKQSAWERFSGED